MRFLYATTDEGHFVDRTVGKLTDLEKGDQVASAVATAIEYFALVAVFAIPLLLLFGGLRNRKAATITGGAIATAGVVWYRSIGDWDQRQNTILDKWQIPVGDWVEQVTVWVDLNMKETLDVIKWPFYTMLKIIVDEWLLGLSWLTICLAALFAGWAFRGLQVGVGSFLGLTICGLLGEEYWKETSRTIGFITVAVILCVIIGIPTGVACGRIDGVWRIVRPVLDAMQVVHSFVYMLPFVFFFGVGFVSATMVTMVFALPPLIRLTNLGIRQVPEDVVEAARAYGASERRVLTDVQLPLARAALMTGINQTLLLAISMLGIAAIMGAGGLGRLLYRAIANQDIALAGSGGLAFFIVAVVLDRLTQPDDSDGGGLFRRITAAWKNTKTPELLLPSAQNDSTADSLKDNDEDDEAAQYEPLRSAERSGVMVATLGAVTTLLGVLLPWNGGAGHISAYARYADESLTDQTFNGLAASGGSWFGILIVICTLALAGSVYATVRSPGQRNRWLGPDGATIFSLAALVAAICSMFASPPNAASEFSRYYGLYVTVIGCVLMAAGSVLWVWNAPMGARRPLSSGVRWGRLFGVSFAGLLIVIAGYSGWTFDTRADSVIGPELQVQLDEILEKAEAAEAAGDLQLSGSLAAEFTALIAYAQRTGDVIYDGYSGEGAGLGWMALIIGALTLLVAIPASGVVSDDEKFLYRWCSIVCGLGLGLLLLGIAWVGTIARVADTNLVSGVGALFIVFAGVTSAGTVRGTLAEFDRKQVYT
ncbi:MAG: ABC transporter permease subunit [Actinomycetota bacterium]|nr:ABC transporter permease subunit [Actinomycetota bacterium]